MSEPRIDVEPGKLGDDGGAWFVRFYVEDLALAQPRQFVISEEGARTLFLKLREALGQLDLAQTREALAERRRSDGERR